jgi:hypothetical protein
MRIISAEVDWMVEWSNEPSLKILVDKIPDWSSLEWIELRPGLYYTEQDGYVDKFYYKRPGEGYAGRKFSLKMKSGEIKQLVGPWSSSASALTAAGYPSVDIAITADPEVWTRGHTFYSGTITLATARQAVALISNVQLVELHTSYGILYTFTLIDNPCPGHWIYRTGNNRCEWCGHKVYKRAEAVKPKQLPDYLLDVSGEQLSVIVG